MRVKRRTGKTPQRDFVKNKLQDIFSEADNKQAFLDALDKAGFEVYIRGKNIGILDKTNNRKHRLKTLGILDEFETMSARIKLEEASTKEQEKSGDFKNAKTKHQDEIKNIRKQQSSSENKTSKDRKK